MLNFLKKILKKNYAIYFIFFFIFQKVFVASYSKIQNFIRFLIDYKKNKNFKLRPKEIGKMILCTTEFYYPKYSIALSNTLRNIEETANTEYELVQKNFFGKKIDCIIDIGANIGFLSLFYYKFFGNKVFIYCFEPHPINFFF